MANNDFVGFVSLPKRGPRGGEHYVASALKSTFHHPDCVWADYLLNSPNLLEFDSHEEAVAANYKPCKTCRA